MDPIDLKLISPCATAAKYVDDAAAGPMVEITYVHRSKNGQCVVCGEFLPMVFESVAPLIR